MKWCTVEIQPGSIIRTKLDLIYHYGIYISDNEIIQFGLTPEKGLISIINSVFDKEKINEIQVCTSTLKEFSQYSHGEVEVAVLSGAEKKKSFPSDEIIKRALSRIGETGYDIKNNNSEHFVNDCVFGVKKSHQDEVFKKNIKNKAIVDVYISKLPSSNFEYGDLYPEEKNAEIQSLDNQENSKALNYWGWKILEKALWNSFYYDIKNLVFKKDKYGKWNCNQVYFSISYAKDYVCVAVSNNKIGVDLDLKSDFESKYSDAENKIAFEKSIICNREVSFNYTISDLLLLWQKKESIYNCYGSKSSKKNFDPLKIDSTKYGCSVFSPKVNSDLSVVICGEKVEYIKYYLDENFGFERQL